MLVFLTFLLFFNISLSQDLCPVILDFDRPNTQRAKPFNQHEHIYHVQRVIEKPVRVLQLPFYTERNVNGDLVESKRLADPTVIIVKDDMTFCTGALISSRWVLTAASCELSVTSTEVFIGSNSLTFQGENIITSGQRVLPERVVNHPDFVAPTRNTYRNNVALLRLAEEASTTRIFRLNTMNEPRVATASRAVWYEVGATGDDEVGARKEVRLRQVDIPISRDSTCEEVYPRSFVSRLHICTGNSEVQCGPCFGDFGGPLLQYDLDGNPTLVGTTSYSTNCNKPGVPTVFTRIDMFTDWIVEVGAEFTEGRQLQEIFVKESTDLSPAPNDPFDDMPESGSSLGKTLGSIAGSIVFFIVIAGVIMCFCGCFSSDTQVVYRPSTPQVQINNNNFQNA